MVVVDLISVGVVGFFLVLLIGCGCWLLERERESKKIK